MARRKPPEEKPEPRQTWRIFRGHGYGHGYGFDWPFRIPTLRRLAAEAEGERLQALRSLYDHTFEVGRWAMTEQAQLLHKFVDDVGRAEAKHKALEKADRAIGGRDI